MQSNKHISVRQSNLLHNKCIDFIKMANLTGIYRIFYQDDVSKIKSLSSVSHFYYYTIVLFKKLHIFFFFCVCTEFYTLQSNGVIYWLIPTNFHHRLTDVSGKCCYLWVIPRKLIT